MMLKLNDKFDSFRSRKKSDKLAAVSEVYEKIALARVDKNGNTRSSAEILSLLFGVGKYHNNGLLQQGSTDPEANKTIDAMTPWATLMMMAQEREGEQFVDSEGHSQAEFTDSDPLVFAACDRCIRSFMASTGMDRQDIERELTQRLSDNIIAKRTVTSCVRFFRDASPSWFTECSHCGHENDPPWNVCSKCNMHR